MTDNIVVSICCQTYNHVNSIKQCLDSFLMQKTNFKFEILLRDDASIDGTAKIAKEYTNMHPHIIKPLFYNENQFKKGVKPLADNIKRALGKYIAICEGDDYWTDPYKLQKQVDFLENNNEYGLVYTNYVKLNSNKYQTINCKTFSGDIFDKLIMSNFIGTLTVCFRKDLLDKVVGLKIHDQNFKMGDYPLWIAFSSITKFKYLTDSTSVYRISPNTLSNQLNVIDRFNFEDSVYDIRYFFLKNITVNKNLKNKVDILYINFLILNKKSFKNISKNKYLSKGLRFYFYYFIIFLIQKIFKNKSTRLLSFILL